MPAIGIAHKIKKLIDMRHPHMKGNAWPPPFMIFRHWSLARGMACRLMTDSGVVSVDVETRLWSCIAKAKTDLT
jgi:hypothetical protein